MEITVDVIDKGALRLLHDMEFLKLIRVKTPIVKEKQEEKNCLKDLPVHFTCQMSNMKSSKRL
jgi:hypothetical protein